MDKTLYFIIDAIINNPNDKSLGEEIRALKETLLINAITTRDPLYEFLYALVYHNPNDQVLGYKTRQIKNKLIDYVNAG